jgi:hypothetical protein
MISARWLGARRAPYRGVRRLAALSVLSRIAHK